MSIEKIWSTSLLLVEGKDEVNFFDALLKHLGISDVQVIDVGGKDKFKETINSASKIPGFSSIQKIGFVRDAEEKIAQAAFSNICNSVNKIGISTPKSIGKCESGTYNGNSIRIGIFIMPNNKDCGMLENLCLKSIKGEECYNKMQSYIEYLEDMHTENQSFNINKAMVQTYLASTVPIVNSLGLGAQKGVWNFNNSAFDEIKEFITDLFK